MARKLIKLTLRDIVLQADAQTIREAYEARLKIDELLVKREEAYRAIEAIELQVEELMGEEGLFIYPEPPVPVAGFSKPAPAARPKPKPVPQEVVAEEPQSGEEGQPAEKPEENASEEASETTDEENA